MKRIFLILLFLSISIPIYGQGVHEYRFGNNTLRIKKGVPDFDNWSIMHAGGGAGFYSGLRLVFKLSEKQALIATIIAGYAYEFYVDGLGNKIGFFDSMNSMLSSDKGADLKGDPMFTALGGALACGLDLLFQMKDRKYRLIVNGKSVGLIVPLN